MGVHSAIYFSDLSDEKKEELIKWIKDLLLEDWKEEGEKYLKERKWYVAPKTWQEAFCRIESIDWKMWNDLEEKSEEFQKYDWDYALIEYAEEEAEKRLNEAFRYLEVEIEI